MAEQQNLPIDIFRSVHPVRKALIGLAIAIVVFFLLKREGRDPLIVSMCAWCAFALAYLVFSWITIFSTNVDGIRKVARVNDGSRVFVALLLFLASVASLVFVLLLLINNPQQKSTAVFPLSIAAVTLSWMLIHTTLVFHYAHEYYDDDPEGVGDQRGGLDFPGNQDPEYLDFAYFSFVIGMTFQVSDVQITSRQIRRLVLFHGLIAFGLNTFVVALTINLIGGLSK